MSFLKKLFGGGNGEKQTDSAHSEFEYEGYHVSVTPMNEAGQFRVCGVISKEIDGERKQHTLIRADMCNSADEAADITGRKAKQMIDEQGDRIFR